MSARRFDALTAPLSLSGLMEQLAEQLSAEWGEVMGEAEPLPGSDVPWRAWLARHFSDIATAPLAEHHERLWEWGERLAPREHQSAFVEAWNRGGAKSTTVELVVARAIVRASRFCVLYVCGTQDAADKHIADIQAPLESLGVSRQISRYGTSRGWRQDFLRTENHISVMGIGLDKPIRGLKIGNQRPDLIIFDDIDDETDSPKAVKRKLDRITKTILAARAPWAAVIFVQNLIHAGGIMAQLKAGRTQILQDRYPYQEVPAVLELVTREEIQPDGTTRHKIVSGTPSWAGLDLDACQAAINDLTLSVFLAEYQHVMRQGGSVFFPEFQRTRGGKPWHCILPIRIPTHWPASGGIDYGTRSPFSFHMDRHGPQAERITTTEVYEPGKVATQQAALIRQAVVRDLGLSLQSDNKVWLSVWAGMVAGKTNPELAKELSLTEAQLADICQAIGAKTGLDIPIYCDTAPSIFPPEKPEDRVGTYPADDYWAAGLNVIPAQKSRVSGWGRMRENLVRTVIDALAGDPEEAEAVPAWRVVEAACPHLVQQMDDAVSDQDQPEDLDDGCEDHALDDTRYRQMGPELKAGPTPEQVAEQKRKASVTPRWAQKEKKNDYV